MCCSNKYAETVIMRSMRVQGPDEADGNPVHLLRHTHGKCSTACGQDKTESTAGDLVYQKWDRDCEIIPPFGYSGNKKTEHERWNSILCLLCNVCKHLLNLLFRILWDKDNKLICMCNSREASKCYSWYSPGHYWQCDSQMIITIQHWWCICKWTVLGLAKKTLSVEE